MKNFIYLSFLAFLFVDCKQNTEKQVTKPKITIGQKIANAHGFEHWKNVSRIDFTFNVDRDSSHFERTWFWDPMADVVVMKSEEKTVKYSRNRIDSTLTKTDAAFINDKFWLLIPFQLVWDKDASISKVTTETAPISKNELNKITISYSNTSGGYTPGDAYDIYFGDDYLIKEWIYRKGNQKEPSLTSTFENYQDFNGLKLALEHKKANENWNLNFTNIKVFVE